MTAPTSRPLYHLALAADWRDARAAGEYRVSTRGATLDEVGFVHAARAHQLRGVAHRFYGDVDDDLVVLVIAPDRLDAPVVDEIPTGAGEAFPHIYGPVPVSAVVDVRPVRRSAAGTLVLPDLE